MINDNYLKSGNSSNSNNLLFIILHFALIYSYNCV